VIEGDRMKSLPTGKSKLTVITWILFSLSVLVLTILFVQAYRKNLDWRTIFGDMLEKNEIISQMKTDLLKSVEAEKYSVLADTDEESKTFAQQSIAADGAVDANFRKLNQIIESDQIEDEKKLLQAFGKCWGEFLKIDQQLLDFAVQNTNLKAARLSFTKAKEALKRFELSLAEMMGEESSSPDGNRVANLAYAALSDAFDIYSLQAPHIIETSDKEMDKIESSMAQSDFKVKSALQTLEGIVSDKSSAQLKEAEAAFSNFEALNQEILSLSRRNTNIRSMELSLGVKRKVTAECLESLSALQQTVKSTTFKATR
jgi:hypothetical protein